MEFSFSNCNWPNIYFVPVLNVFIFTLMYKQLRFLVYDGLKKKSETAVQVYGNVVAIKRH